MITAAWAEQKAIKEVMVFLQGVGVSTSLAVRIYKKYGDASISVVRAEPYRLASDVWGIGFKTADTIAAAVGIARDSPERIKAGLGVFNGTVGVVTGLSVEDHKLTVLTDEDEPVDYGFDELDELAHAYAVTIHRSQGSEYPAVVIPLTMGSWMMLQRNLLYTAVTRAKKLVVLAGSRRALAVAVRTKGAGRRHTALGHRMRTGGAAGGLRLTRLPPARGPRERSRL
jgi:ATP-dependent exoDNAse (exonuclease V) alpha subunit